MRTSLLAALLCLPVVGCSAVLNFDEGDASSETDTGPDSGRDGAVDTDVPDGEADTGITDAADASDALDASDVADANDMADASDAMDGGDVGDADASDVADAADTSDAADAPSCTCVSDPCSGSSEIRNGGYVAMGVDDAMGSASNITIDLLECVTNRLVRSSDDTPSMSICTESPVGRFLWSTREALVTESGCYYAVLSGTGPSGARSVLSQCSFGLVTYESTPGDPACDPG